ncbi:hypothetical protein U9M48_035326 [Paspalum notatum var. saurae]|uniref:Uncharacterized protein n=1 Tax=Paspalum notatum var. saurae TaxID=547442 RepID=A0AAQ3UAW9_PASNO
MHIEHGIEERGTAAAVDRGARGPGAGPAARRPTPGRRLRTRGDRP